MEETTMQEKLGKVEERIEMLMKNIREEIKLDQTIVESTVSNGGNYKNVIECSTDIIANRKALKVLSEVLKTLQE